MSPEVAAVVGVVIGAAVSALVSIVLQTRSQAAEERRLDRLLHAEAERQHAEFESRRKDEQDRAARETRRARLRAGLDVLDDIERSMGAFFAAEALEDARKRSPEIAKGISEEDWSQAKARVRSQYEARILDWLAANVPKLMTFPIEDMRTDLAEMAVAVHQLPTMTRKDRGAFGRRVRDAQARIDAEIIRGTWP